LSHVTFRERDKERFSVFKGGAIHVEMVDKKGVAARKREDCENARLPKTHRPILKIDKRVKTSLGQKEKKAQR